MLRQDDRDPARRCGREEIRPEAHGLLDEERVAFAQATNLRGVASGAEFIPEPGRCAVGAEPPQRDDARLARQLPHEVAYLATLDELVLARWS